MLAKLARATGIYDYGYAAFHGKLAASIYLISLLRLKMLQLINGFTKFVVTSLLVLTVCCSVVQAKGRPFIIDTDVGVDDAIAMLYLLQRPDINVKAITIASTGNAHCLPALRNTLGLLKMMNRSDIPVDCGRLSPLAGNHHFPSSVLDESDTLAGAAKLLPQVRATSQQNGVDLLISTVQTSKQPITILAIGPLTNIAEALQKAPEIKNHIQAIYIMGGAINVPGNLKDAGVPTTNLTAEWNIYLDPLAASIVVNQDIPVILVPLDVTSTVPVNMSFYHALKKNHRTAAAQFVFSLYTNNLKMLRAKQWFFWDSLAAVIASDEAIASFKTQPLKVTLTPEIESGRTAIDNIKGQTIRVAIKVANKRFTDMLIDNLNRS